MVDPWSTPRSQFYALYFIFAKGDISRINATLKVVVPFVRSGGPLRTHIEGLIR